MYSNLLSFGIILTILLVSYGEIVVINALSVSVALILKPVN